MLGAATLTLGFACAPSVIPNSDRSVSHPCVGSEHEVCPFKCNDGFIPVGLHTCQTYSGGGKTYLNQTFFGGRCDRLCPTTADVHQECPVPLRVNSSDSLGPCLETVCLQSETDALMHLARGSYQVFLASRNNVTGIYTMNVDLSHGKFWQPSLAGGFTDGTGIGLMSEAIADELRFAAREDIQSRVIRTLETVTDKTAGVKMARSTNGFFPTIFDSRTGSSRGSTGGAMGSGLLTVGALFVKTHFERADPGSALTTRIASLVDDLWFSMKWENILCSKNSSVDPLNGTGIPFAQMLKGNKCAGAEFPNRDGLYEYTEEMYSVWLAHERSCHGKPAGSCENRAIDQMWQRWQGRRKAPNHEYDGHPLLSMWSGYIVQLVYYTVHPFLVDPDWTALFKSHWLADWAWYNKSMLAGERGRYGLGAGPSDPHCTEGLGYVADRISEGKGHCRTYSPYVTAGYLPVAPSVIVPQLMQQLFDGEAVVSVPGTPLHVLWRKSLLDPAWRPPDITIIDFCSELFGLAAHLLGIDFFVRNTNHSFPPSVARLVDDTMYV
eukprot:TRINITY_DN16927_c0_g1_i2.p1 TRINITY_DN16927_c0_g1~~TRINITY_DN16927_c0_g1_i2.p1  ORF type:complete len:560 (-),score=47.58 TRINITY_DN16927_c0_g1_i2:177-1829(-)